MLKMYSIYWSVFLLFLTGTTCGQTNVFFVINDLSGQPVRDVQVLGSVRPESTKYHIGFSDVNGEVSVSFYPKNLRYITLSHISYEDTTFLYGFTSTIVLKEKNNTLDEIRIVDYNSGNKLLCAVLDISAKKADGHKSFEYRVLIEEKVTDVSSGEVYLSILKGYYKEEGYSGCGQRKSFKIKDKWLVFADVDSIKVIKPVPFRLRHYFNINNYAFALIYNPNPINTHAKFSSNNIEDKEGDVISYTNSNYTVLSYLSVDRKSFYEFVFNEDSVLIQNEYRKTDTVSMSFPSKYNAGSVAWSNIKSIRKWSYTSNRYHLSLFEHSNYFHVIDVDGLTKVYLIELRVTFLPIDILNIKGLPLTIISLSPSFSDIVNKTIEK